MPIEEMLGAGLGRRFPGQAGFGFPGIHRNDGMLPPAFEGLGVRSLASQKVDEATQEEGAKAALARVGFLHEL